LYFLSTKSQTKMQRIQFSRREREREREGESDYQHILNQLLCNWITLSCTSERISIKDIFCNNVIIVM